MEFIALFLLVPLFWSDEKPTPLLAETVQIVEAHSVSDVSPRIESVDGQWVVRPPRDASLTMTVLEHRGSGARGPASANRIDVIVSAP